MSGLKLPHAFRRRARHALFLTTALGTLAALPAVAQDRQGQAGKPFQLGPLKVEDTALPFTSQPPTDKGYRAERITSATKTDTPLRDVPQAITVITRQQIEDQGIRSMADTVRYVPGVSFAQGEGNRDTPVFRGNATTSDFFIDGVRDDVQYFRDLYNIERVEVLRGPNAMIFGRGGAGGVINRVTRQADFERTREVRLEGGQRDQYRGSFDIGQGLEGMPLALRLTGVYEDSGSYRDGVELERWGLNPTATLQLGDRTLVQFGYEHFEDERTADRGIPSYLGRPLKTGTSTFFGDPDQSLSDARVDTVTLAVEHQFDNGLNLRNRTRYGDYSKFYQNIFPGAVNTAGTTVSISGYNNGTERENLFNQTDLTYALQTGSLKHTLLAGAELGRQETDNLRLTAFFPTVSPTATSVNVSVFSPRINLPVTFAPGATDANNHGVAKFAALYLQDQVELTEQLQAVVGLRYDHFNVKFRNNPTGQRISTTDNLWSPRAGLIFKPVEPVSVYASYSMTYVPRAGEQLSSLTLTNASLDPEEFRNYEVGVKWDVLAELSVNAALYQLDRKNVAVTDPLNPANTILVGAQRSRGFELGVTGQVTERWSITAAYAWQLGEVTRTQSATVVKGASLAQTPKHSIALWNRYDVTDDLGVGLGITHQTRRYTSTDNLVTMPSYTRVDGALFYTINETFSAQVNVENIFDKNYFPNAHSNNNITPGAPRTFRAALTAKF